MQPSTWNDTNQHWVPQFLLKGFGIRRKASSVYELDKQTKSTSMRKVSEAASKPRLLTERDDELMGKIEKNAEKAVGAIRKGRLDLVGENERRFLDQLVAAMLLNDPHNGLDLAAARGTVIAENVRAISDAKNRHGRDFDAAACTKAFEEALTYDALSLLLDPSSNVVTGAFRLMGLRTYKPKDDGELFIIGDSPVLTIYGRMNGEASLLNPGTQVILPIGSKSVLVYAWEYEHNVINDGGVLDRQQLRWLNSVYCHGSNCRYIYGRNEETLKRTQRLQLNWAPQQRSENVGNGWFAMQSLYQAEQMKKRAHDEEMARTFDQVGRSEWSM